MHVSVKRGSRKRVFVLEKRVPGGQAVGMRWPSATGNGKAVRQAEGGVRSVVGSGSVICTKRRGACNVGRSLAAGGRPCFRGVQVRQGCGVTVGEAGEAAKRAKGRRVTKQQKADMGISE